MIPTENNQTKLLYAISHLLDCSIGSAYVYAQNQKREHPGLTLEDIVEFLRNKSVPPNLIAIFGPPKIPKRIEFSNRPFRKSSDPDINWQSHLTMNMDFSSWIGIEEVFDHTKFVPGEKIVICSKDKVAYHLTTWEFLKREKGGRCIICDRIDSMELCTLPSTERNIFSEPILGPKSPSLNFGTINSTVNATIPSKERKTLSFFESIQTIIKVLLSNWKDGNNK